MENDRDGYEGFEGPAAIRGRFQAPPRGVQVRRPVQGGRVVPRTATVSEGGTVPGGAGPVRGSEGGRADDADYPLILAGSVTVPLGGSAVLTLTAKQALRVRAVAFGIKESGGAGTAADCYITSISRSSGIALYDCEDNPLRIGDGSGDGPGFFPFNMVGYSRWFMLPRGHQIKARIENRGDRDATFSMFAECYARTYL